MIKKNLIIFSKIAFLRKVLTSIIKLIILYLMNLYNLYKNFIENYLSNNLLTIDVK